MEKTVIFCVLFILSCFFRVNFVVGERNGLTIKLIYRDSPESPSYQPNLTNAQLFERLINQSKARLKYLSVFPSDLRSTIVAENPFVFTTQLGLGTFHNPNEPFRSYYFAVDVGSSLTWVECRDCKLPIYQCIHPNSQPFPDLQSTSFKKIICPTRARPHTLCDPRDCIGKFCAFDVEYDDNSTLKGFLANETFTFHTIHGAHWDERIPDVVFGCGFDMRNMGYKDTRVSGILGLGYGQNSFVTQLGTRSKGKFSYCLPNRQDISTFLHFGDNIPTTRAMHSTPLHKYRKQSEYFVNLTGISVSGTPLDLTAHDFARKPNRKGGCVIDSGTSVSQIPNFAYVKLKEVINHYFDHVRGFTKVHVPQYDLCYLRTGPSQGFRNLPTVTFHFLGADLVIQPEHVFVKDQMHGRDGFCLGMLPHHGRDRVLVIGAYQQVNYRFVFLTQDGILRFGPENCTANA